MRDLYWKQKTSARVGVETSMCQAIKRGVRQGFVRSTEHFILYSAVIMRKITNLEGTEFHGSNINNLRYADDTALVPDSEEKLKCLVQALVQASEEQGLRLHISKTKVMVISKRETSVRTNIVIDKKILEQVEKYKYLGSVITQNGRCNEVIKTRIVTAKTTSNKIKPLIINRSVSLKLRKIFIKCYVWYTLMYGCETWTVTKDMETKNQATEMWFLRTMMKISWTDRASNEIVLQCVGTKRELMKIIRKRQLRFLVRAMRPQQLESVRVTGRVEGRSGRGRPRMELVDSLAKVIGREMSPAELLQLNFERSCWRSMVANVLEDTAIQ